MKPNEQQERIKRAEDYISNMLNTMMSVSALLSTISVALLAVITKSPDGIFTILIIMCVLISSILFIWAFWQGRESQGTLILALKQGKSGFDEARLPAWKCQKILFSGLIFLAIACAFFFIGILLPFIKAPVAIGKVTMTPLVFKLLKSLGYMFIMIGSIGMIFFAIKFPLSGRIKDLELVSDRLLGLLNGYQVWKWSWSERVNENETPPSII